MSAIVALASAVNCFEPMESRSFFADSDRKSWSTEGINLRSESVAFDGLDMSGHYFDRMEKHNASLLGNQTSIFAASE
jgi:hypothetical protein